MILLISVTALYMLDSKQYFMLLSFLMISSYSHLFSSYSFFSVLFIRLNITYNTFASHTEADLQNYGS